MNYFLKSTAYVEDTNISKWAEVEEGGKLARGCPPREAGEVRGTRPAGLRLPLWRHSMGTMVWVVVGPAGSGELWLMAEGPDYPPERGPEAELPQAQAGAALACPSGDITWGQVMMDMSEPQSLSP